MKLTWLFPLLALLVALSLTPAPARAQGPLPNSLAAAGDSLSRGSGAGPRYFADSSAFGWATGGDPSVNSLALRIATRNPALAGNVYNVSRYGARMIDLSAQIATINAVRVEYVTIMLGGNDACALTEATMTPVDTFREQFRSAMALLDQGSPQARVLVMSIPDPTKLLPILGNNPRANLIWDAFGVCQSALLRPTSTLPEDIERRARVRQRVMDYNTALAEVCAAYPRCRYDGGLVFDGTLEAADISPFDFFHLSARGQARIADAAWTASGFGQ
ncbi:MAG: SGNH/GDSL hydrolase family protein [Oscillochloridaceae bacterium umkhey_bin13]